MTRFAVASIYTKNILPLAVITVEYNKRKYCEKQGYNLIVKNNNFTYKDIGFTKISFVLDILKTDKYEWIYWCGCDTMITNYNTKLEDMIDNNYHFIISYDVWDFNSDSFLIRNSPEAIKYFEHILSLYDMYIDQNGNPIDHGLRLPDGGGRAWAEQGAMIDLYNDYEEYRQIIKPMPQKFMNSYLYHMYPSSWHKKGIDCKGNPGSWSEGDFLVHWPGMDNDTRIYLALNFLEHVKGNLDF